MLINFNRIKEEKIINFKDGEGIFFAKRVDDGKNKILHGRLCPAASIGLHLHEDSSEIFFILSGEGKVICNGVEEYLSSGDCHYCPKGSVHSLINIGKEDLCFYAVVPVQ